MRVEHEPQFSSKEWKIRERAIEKQEKKFAGTKQETMILLSFHLPP